MNLPLVFSQIQVQQLDQQFLFPITYEGGLHDEKELQEGDWNKNKKMTPNNRNSIVKDIDFRFKR